MPGLLPGAFVMVLRMHVAVSPGRLLPATALVEASPVRRSYACDSQIFRRHFHGFVGSALRLHDVCG